MKLLFFSPNAAILSHAHPEAVLANSLSKLGHNVLYVNCGKVLDELCTSMIANGLTGQDSIEKKKNICIECEKISYYCAKNLI